jgi:hemerythrin
MSEKKLINWSAQYCLGHDQIDSQHKRLVEMINELYDAFSRGEANNVIGDIVDKMIKYTEYHFSTEEKMFEQYEYTLSDEHKGEHDFFVQQAKKFYDEYQSGSAVVPYEVMNFLRDWLIKHILHSDKLFCQDLRGRNLM